MQDLPKPSGFTSAANQLHVPSMSSDLFTPRRTKEMLESPFHNTFSKRKTPRLPRPPQAVLTPKLPRLPQSVSTPKTDIIDTYCQCLLNTMERCLRGEPLRTEELMRSPLHSNFMPKQPKPRLPKNKPEQRLVDYLKQLTAYNSISKRIQQMSIQDLIDILNHLLPFAGIRITVNKKNYVEQTVDAMQQLNYPHKINKSWLKVPVASLKNILLILDFLLDFALTKKD